MGQYGLRYDGPVYRPPSEANSLLVQATVGCPHNQCTFCMVYKRGPKYRVRPVEDIIEDIDRAAEVLKDSVRTVFYPAGNTIAMDTGDLVSVLEHTRRAFPSVERITVYGSSKYVLEKGADGMKRLAEAGLDRIHIGLESGDDVVLARVKKGVTADGHVEAGMAVKAAGIDLSEYVMLGIGGVDRTDEHIGGTIDVLNRIDPDFIRVRTFLPKVNTPLLIDIEKGRFEVLSPHQVLGELRTLIEGLDVTSTVASDHYTNYANVRGRMPEDRGTMLERIDRALEVDERNFRPVYVGTQ